MKILVTGAAGFIGRNLAEMLERADKSGKHEVLYLDRAGCKPWRAGNEFTHVSEVDLGGSSADLFIPDFDLCYHLAADARIQPSFDNPRRTFYSNVVGTLHILEKARQCGGSVVYAGSSTADWRPTANPYAMTKLQGEQLCQLYTECFNVPTAIARFYNVYGPGQIEDGPYKTVMGVFARQYRNYEPLTVTGDGSQTRDFTHVEDICSALVTIAGKGDLNGGVYSLGSGRPVSVLNLAKMFDETKIKFIDRPPGEAPHTRADLSKLQALGWTPNWSVEPYVRILKAARGGQ